MTHNLNTNDDLCEKSNTAGELRKDYVTDMMVFSEDIRIIKTEVKEECYDFDMPIDNMEFGYIKEEYISSPENNFREENLGSMTSTQQPSNENVEIITITKTDVKEECYDFEMRVADLEFVDIAKEYISLSENNFRRENLEPMESTKQTLNEDVVSENCQLRKNDLQKEQEFSKKRFDLKRSKAEFTSDCKYTTEYNCDLERHIRTNYKPFKCTYKYCNCTPEQKETCKCNTCGYASPQKGAVKKHILVKHSGKLKKYECANCKYATNIKGNLIAHIRTHTNNKPFKCTHKNCGCTPGQRKTCNCNTCGFAAATKGNLNIHILVKHSGKSKKYKCADCEYATHLKSDLERHIRTHINDRPFKCTYKNCECSPGQKGTCKCNTCTYATTSQGNLKNHVLVKHSGKPKKYKCRDCNYAAHRRILLTQHIRTHTNDRQFKCTYKNCKCTPGQKETCKCNTCGYAAERTDSLKRHILLKHSGKLKKYKCADCEYATHTKSGFERHTAKKTTLASKLIRSNKEQLLLRR